MTLILRKLLASSTYAIYGTFCSLINRLKHLLSQNGVYSDDDDIIADYEHDNDKWVDDDEAEDNDVQELHPDDIEKIKSEIKELETFKDLAGKIKKTARPSICLWHWIKVLNN